MILGRIALQCFNLVRIPAVGGNGIPSGIYLLAIAARLPISLHNRKAYIVGSIGGKLMKRIVFLRNGSVTKVPVPGNRFIVAVTLEPVTDAVDERILVHIKRGITIRWSPWGTDHKGFAPGTDAVVTRGNGKAYLNGISVMLVKMKGILFRTCCAVPEIPQPTHDIPPGIVVKLIGIGFGECPDAVVVIISEISLAAGHGIPDITPCRLRLCIIYYPGK